MLKKTVILVLMAVLLSFSQTPRFKQLGACYLGPDSWWECFDVVVLDSFAYLASEHAPVINIARPDSPFVAARIDSTHTFRHAISLSLPYVFILGSNRVGSFDLSNMQAPVFLDSVGIRFLYGDIALNNGYAYCGGDDLHLVDVRNPDSLVYLGKIDSTRLVGRLAVDSNYLYELVVTESLYIWDLANLSNPQIIGACSLGNASWFRSEPCLRDTLLYIPRARVGSRQIALWIVNVADPSNPFLLAQSPDTGGGVEGALDITVSGNFAYATMFTRFTDRGRDWHRQEHDPHLAVFDVSDPANPFPVWINEVDPCNYSTGIDSRADTIYLCDGDSFYIYVDTSWTGIKEEIHEIINYDFGPTIFSGSLFLPKGKKCKVFDIMGRIVEPQHISCGIYFIEIDGQITRKIVKIR